MLPIAIVWLLVMISIVVLPLFGIMYLWLGFWKDAAICFVGWAILVWACRRFRFGQIWEWPPSYL